MLQKACRRQSEADIKNAGLQKKPQAKKRQTSSDNQALHLQKESRETRETLRNKDQELRELTREICNKDRALRLAERKLRASS